MKKLMKCFLIILSITMILSASQMTTIASDILYEKTHFEQTHYHYYKNQLNNLYEIEMYENIEKSLLPSKGDESRFASNTIKFKESVPLPSGIDPDDEMLVIEETTKIFQKTFDAFKFDHPEFYWITGNCTAVNITLEIFDKGDIRIHSAGAFFQPMKTTKEELEAIQNAAEIIIIEANKLDGDFEKLKKVHDMLAKKIKYNNDEAIGYRNFQITGALVDGVGVCEAYAKSFKYITDQMGYQSVLVVGTGISGNEAVPHMWNYIKISDKWYGVDVTWDDQLVTLSDYFLVGKTTKALNFDNLSFKQVHLEERFFSTVEYKDPFYYPQIAYDRFELGLVF